MQRHDMAIQYMREMRDEERRCICVESLHVQIHDLDDIASDQEEAANYKEANALLVAHHETSLYPQAPELKSFVSADGPWEDAEAKETPRFHSVKMLLRANKRLRLENELLVDKVICSEREVMKLNNRLLHVTTCLERHAQAAKERRASMKDNSSRLVKGKIRWIRFIDIYTRSHFGL
jgi:hypothetical protein